MVKYLTKPITVGSRYFFEGMPGFHPHDFDRIQLVETDEFPGVRTIRGRGEDWFFYKSKTKDELIADAVRSPLAMVVGKFLVPEFCDAIGFTYGDLGKIKPLIDRLDEKHVYERIIYEAYLANGSLTLTDEQRLAAYESYEASRQAK